MTTTPATQVLLPCPFCKQSLRVVPSLARSFSPPRPLVEYVHANSGCLMGRWMRAFYDDEPETFAKFAAQWNDSKAHSLPGDVGMREAALVDAVRGALECLGKPDGYLPDIGAPKTRALQLAFEAYEPHPTFKGY